jgi:hypothetical protein
MTAPTLARAATGAVRVPLAWARDLDAVQVDIYHRLRTRRGTALDDIARGLPWLDWLQRRPVPLVEIQAAVRAQLVAIPEVVAVERVTASRTDDAGLLIEAVVTVRLLGRALSLALSVADPYQTSGPPLYFQIVG